MVMEKHIIIADVKLIRMIRGVTRWDRKINNDLCRQSNLLPIVQVINKNKLLLFGHVMRRQKESTLSNEVKDEAKETKRKITTKVARQHQ